MQPPALEQRVVGHRAAVTVDRVDQIADDPTQLFGEVLAGDIDEFGFDVGDRAGAFGCVRVRDHDRVPGGDLSSFERGRDLREVSEFACQFDVAACDALVDPTYGPKRGRGVEEPVGAPVA